MISPTYPHLSPAMDAVYATLWQAKGEPVSYDDLHEAYKPGVRYADKVMNVKAVIKRMRKRLGLPARGGFIQAVNGVGYKLKVADALPYVPKRPCWLSNRFLVVV